MVKESKLRKNRLIIDDEAVLRAQISTGNFLHDVRNHAGANENGKGTEEDFVERSEHVA